MLVQGVPHQYGLNQYEFHQYAFSKISPEIQLSTILHKKPHLYDFNLYDFASKSPTSTNSTNANCHQIPPLVLPLIDIKVPPLVRFQLCIVVLANVQHFVGQCKNVLNWADGYTTKSIQFFFRRTVVQLYNAMMKFFHSIAAKVYCYSSPVSSISIQLVYQASLYFTHKFEWQPSKNFTFILSNFLVWAQQYL